jgi:hypothetical protein
MWENQIWRSSGKGMAPLGLHQMTAIAHKPCGTPARDFPAVIAPQSHCCLFSKFDAFDNYPVIFLTFN